MKRQFAGGRFVQGLRYVFAVGAVLLASLPAAAQSPVSDTVALFQNGMQFATFPLTEAQESTLLTLLSISSIAPTGDAAQYGSYTVLTEPDGTISDVYGVVPATTMGTFNVAFFSDSETGSTVVPSVFINPTGAGTPIMMAEGNGGPFDATTYLSPELRRLGFTAQFVSDAEAVPEPSSLMLLGLGTIGLASYVYRRRTVAV